VTLSLRPLAADDAQITADLVGDYDERFGGIAERPTAEDIVDWWKRIDAGATAVLDGGGALIGAGTLRTRGPNLIADLYVHPDRQGLGAGSLLLDWAESGAAENGADALRAGTAAGDTRGKELLEVRGFRYIRSFYRMSIDLDHVPPAPEWPAGFAFAVEHGQERLLYEALEEAFEDHWGNEPRTYEEWIAHNGPFGDRLCYLVRDEAGTVVAAQVCDEDRWSVAWVAILGVRRDWRRHGLGEALLRQAFHDLAERGRRRIVLGVDAENTTGATRLYTRVGMTVAYQEDIYEKPVPGA
jgi:ribosomal protein S18 acetylase RimI-like enzyme